MKREWDTWHVIQVARNITHDANQSWIPERKVSVRSRGLILDPSILKGTRDYIESIEVQIDLSYENSCFDACLVLMRRLLETLIIEVFEHYSAAHEIQDQHGDYKMLSDLVSALLNSQHWNLGRNSKKALPKLKSLGDLSAHSRRFIARRGDVDKCIDDFRLIVEELIHLAQLK